jgi:flavin reductase (DIM6/NTAB) family NADH-FMN oxidoreductase RutF
MKMIMKSFGQKPWVMPQPVLIIGTYNNDGTPNAMNAAWGGQWDMKEIMISMGAHATTENLNRCADFTVAFATQSTLVASDFVGIVSAKNDANKMKKTGWTFMKSENVNAPVFGDFPMTLECRLKEKIGEDENGYNIIAEIVNILVDEAYIGADGMPDVEKMELIAYESVHHGYIAFGGRVGNAFSDGKKLK